MTEDLRRNPRVPLESNVDVVYEGATTTGRAHDISLGGMFVFTTTQVPFGSKVTLRFRLPGSEVIELSGIVRWKRDDGMGVQFGSFGARETYAITEHVRQGTR